MRKYLLPENGRFYKVNMHSHTTLSDGRTTPEEVKEAYKAAGYAAVAYTEHNKLCDLTHLNDEDFIAITSYELDISDKESVPFTLYEGKPKTFAHMETVHLNLYSRDPHRTEALDVSDIKNSYSVETINEAIRRAKEAGFLVCYNHPHWSLNTFNLYTNLKGVDALEIINGASQRSSDMDYAPHVYDEMARYGVRANVVSGDDNHGQWAYFKAWTMVKAEELSHTALLDAIERGDCYSSQGPEIYELYVEDGKVHVKCSDAVGIFYSTAGRAKNCKLDETYENPVNEAAFTINPDDIFFRITVKDARGNRANTRIFYTDEVL